jgi:DNA-binding CsgD family transcriptional regulator
MREIVEMREEVLEGYPRYNFTFGQIAETEDTITYEKKIVVNEPELPLSLFKNDLSCLRLIVCYLRDKRAYSLTTIAHLLHRSVQTIWISYRSSKKITITSSTDYFIPLRIFDDERLTILENIVHYLSGYYKNVEMARILHKDPRTIWTLKKRIEQKISLTK